jgi:hypothetical protein
MKTPIILLAACMLGSTAVMAQDTTRKANKTPQEKMRKQQEKNKNRLDSTAIYNKERDRQRSDTMMNRTNPPLTTPPIQGNPPTQPTIPPTTTPPTVPPPPVPTPPSAQKTVQPTK